MDTKLREGIGIAGIQVILEDSAHINGITVQSFDEEKFIQRCNTINAKYSLSGKELLEDAYRSKGYFEQNDDTRYVDLYNWDKCYDIIEVEYDDFIGGGFKLEYSNITEYAVDIHYT